MSNGRLFHDLHKREMAERTPVRLSFTSVTRRLEIGSVSRQDPVSMPIQRKTSEKIEHNLNLAIIIPNLIAFLTVLSF